MKPLSAASADDFAGVRFVLTDMDETLTFQGRLAADTYDALERLQAAGVVVVPVTAAPAGWADQMARMWPVDLVIAENGGVVLERDGHGARRGFWSSTWPQDLQKLTEIADEIQGRIAAARLADDQFFRLASLAFVADDDAALRSKILAALSMAGLRTTQNNLWLLGWLGQFDKLAMARRVLVERFGLDIDADGDAVAYVGDSVNDAPMFEFFRRTAGVSTVRRYLDQMSSGPAWITDGPGGSGFVEVANAIIAAR